MDPRGQLRRVAEFLQLDASDEQLEQIITAYQPQHWDNKPKFFNQGVIGRYKEVLTAQEQALCRRRLGRYLARMEYVD